MKKEKRAFHVLHISDFHISEESEKNATEAINVLIKKIKDMNINISYLIHTGDIINSAGIEEKIKQMYGADITDEEYDNYLEEVVRERLKIAKKIMGILTDELDILHKNVAICCGNHDKVRYKKRENQAFVLFEEFLEDLKINNDLTGIYEMDDLRVLVLNTNVSDDKRVTCIDCEKLKNVFNLENQSQDQTNWFYTYSRRSNPSPKEDKVNVIVAHQPLYDICEHIRLPYGSETQTTDFLSALQDFVSGNGVYLCGDKHTSSIAASYIHDIPHYFCGHPFVFVKNNLPSQCKCKETSTPKDIKIDYNLIEVKNGEIGQVRKLHLLKRGEKEWKCQIHPIDAIVSNLYENSRKYIVKNSYALLATQSSTKYSSWVNLSWRNLFNRIDNGIGHEELKDISDFYGLFCRLKNDLGQTIEWDKNTNVFAELTQIVEKLMGKRDTYNTRNIMNIRGDYSSGKSTFLGLFYIYLLYHYSYGRIGFIPAYFNMENDDILNKIQNGSTYSLAVRQTFSTFVEKVENIARTEHVPVCYIVDGLDEQDIWSESSQDSVGRVALDILEETKDSKYIMSFCQNRLARFKNTMSAIKYYEKSYVMYFNSISVKEKENENHSFVDFVKYVVGPNNKKDEETLSVKHEGEWYEPDECSVIRKLRRLSINTGFIYHNYQYLKECKQSDSINTVYMRYIDQQHLICLDALGYNFVHYAPAMAYLFTYEGYTYEKFKSIAPGTTNYWEQKILEYSNKIYKTFIFIKKHKDAREYLLALHYNRELRYFAENPKSEIPESSIINKLIPRNISIIIKKLWKNDQNKFIIVCKSLIEKRKMTSSKPINNCTLSMLIYILAYLDKIPDYTRDEIKSILLNEDISKADKMLKDRDPWEISGNNSDKMIRFIDLNFLHSQKILAAISAGKSCSLVRELLNSPNFRLYNRQYMMWYYGDLTIYGENKVNNLVPGKDIVNQGIDYYNCFYTLYHKIYDCVKRENFYPYPLLEFDLFTICDLIYSRKIVKDTSKYGRIFTSEDDKEQEVYKCTKDVLTKYILHHTRSGTDEMKDFIDEINIEEEKQENPDEVKQEPFEMILARLNKEIKTDEKYVFDYFRMIKQLFPQDLM